MDLLCSPEVENGLDVCQTGVSQHVWGFCLGGIVAYRLRVHVGTQGKRNSKVGPHLVARGSVQKRPDA